MQEKDNILRILEETKQAIKSGDATKLKELSNQTVHTSSITQDPDNITIAVMVYSLSKILERTEYNSLPGWDRLYRLILDSINNLSIAVQEDNPKKIKKYLTSWRKSIEKLSGKLKIYIQDVFRKAEINKASKIYEHGISMGKTASLLGITMFELVSYAGQKQEIVNLPLGHTIDIKSRIKLTEDLFK
jgi:hypothetical protein